MGSDVQYENQIINHTFEPLGVLLSFFIAIACFGGAVYFYIYTRKKLQPPEEKPQVATKKTEVKATVKSDEGIKAKYSDEHLVVTSNMAERLKMFSGGKIMK